VRFDPRLEQAELSFPGAALQNMSPRLQQRDAFGGETEGRVGAVDLLLPHQRAAAQVPRHVCKQVSKVHLLKIVVAVLQPGAAKMGRSRIFDEGGH
jgi:hypothetical protein